MSIEEIKKELIVTIIQVKKAFALLMSERLIPFGITFEQWVVLRTVYQNGSIPAKSVAELSEKDTSTITRVLDQLEKKQLILRVKNTLDRRSILIEITKRGEEISKHVVPLEQDLHSRASVGISMREIHEATNTFKKLLHNYEQIKLENHGII